MIQAEPSHETKSLLRLTMACNERCPFCNVPAEDYPSRPAPRESILQQLDEMAERGAQTATVSGGEPTLLRARLLETVREARARGLPFIEIQTNAILIDLDYAEDLKRAGVTSAFVSLLSHQPELHDELAGLRGAFPRCLAGIDALLEVGIRVTLNPVIARSSQATFADYIDFVAARLSGVDSISVSAVQPHGRAASRADRLLPDYELLRPVLREAQSRARARGITLLNPYCGVPLCVWGEARDHSVEAEESRSARPAGGERMRNRGNKRQGAACLPCAERSRCGGAWHAWWEHRGEGLQPPSLLGTPWGRLGPLEGAASLHEPGWEAELERLLLEEVPNRWLRATRLRPEWVPGLLRSPCTDLAWSWPGMDRDSLQAARNLITAQQGSQPQERLRIWAGLSGEPSAVLLQEVQLLQALGADCVLLLGGGEPLSAFAATLRRAGSPCWTLQELHRSEPASTSTR